LSTVNVDYKDFRWTTDFNITFNDNKILKARYNSIKELTGTVEGVFIKGYPVSSWYGYKFAEVEPIYGEVYAYIDHVNPDGTPIGYKRPDGKYMINMGESVHKTEALEYLGDSQPTYYGGFGTSITFKRLTLNARFTYAGGHKIRSFMVGRSYDIYAMNKNTSKEVMNRWRKPGDVTTFPKLGRYSDVYSRAIFDNQLEDGSYVKFTNLSLTYNLPQKFAAKLKLNRLMVGASVNNLATWTKFKGVDPETLGVFGYPSARRISFNLNIGI
jgi:hypothetical protein